MTFVAVDLETTGLSPGFDRITEFGAARFRVRRDGTIVTGPTLEHLVNPGRRIPPPVARLTGITDEMVADAPPLDAVWADIEAFLGAGGPTVLLAHNARFDLSFLVAGAEQIGREWQGAPMACTVRVARRSLPDAPRYGLEPLVAWLGCCGDEAHHHRALADALHARNVFGRCVAARRPRTLDDLGVPPTRVPRTRELHVDVPDRLAPLMEHIEERRRLRMRYRGGSKGKIKRPVTPLSFYERDGILYLRAWCHLDDVAKSFRADRIREFSY
ncbi:MAG: exonuclease domain-containing protein [Myxococcota bacterium]